MAGEYPSAPSARRILRWSGRRTRGGWTDADTDPDGHAGVDDGSAQHRAGEAGSPSPGALAQRDDPEERARQVCLRLLTLAPRTRAQLADALRKRGIPDDVAESALGRFTSAGLIDDAAFARAWVESRHHGRGLSGRALTAELRQRGVDDDQITEAVDELGPDADAETARRLVERKLAATVGQAPQARVRRLAGMLARKGYPPGLAFRVIRAALESEGMQAAAIEAADLEAEGPEVLMGDEPAVDDLGP